MEFSIFQKIKLNQVTLTYRTSELPVMIRTLHTCTGRHMPVKVYCWHRWTLVTRGWKRAQKTQSCRTDWLQEFFSESQIELNKFARSPLLIWCLLQRNYYASSFPQRLPSFGGMCPPILSREPGQSPAGAKFSLLQSPQ